LLVELLESDRNVDPFLDDVDNKSLRNDGKRLAIRAMSYFNRLAIFMYTQNRLPVPLHKPAEIFLAAQTLAVVTNSLQSLTLR